MLSFEKLEHQVSYLVLDAARAGPPAQHLIALAPESTSLYRGSAEETLRGVAPYLLKWVPQTDLARNFFFLGWGRSWGILLGTTLPLASVQSHLRHFLIVEDEAKRSLYFRFYDPRVLRVFLPTCSRPQLKQLFGPIQLIVMEDEVPDRALVFQLDHGVLRRTVVDLTRPADAQDVPSGAVKRRGEDSLIV